MHGFKINNMANKSISMSKVRQILKLHAQGIGKKKIGLRLGMSKNTVKLYIEKYLGLQIPLDELMKLNDYELDKLFHPPQETIINRRIHQLYEYYPQLEKELHKRGVTVALLFRQWNTTLRRYWLPRSIRLRHTDYVMVFYPLPPE